MSPVPKITVTIITLNEEGNISACLESVKWADEIIVSDSGSTDKTKALCRGYGAKVFDDSWNGYGKQKNLCARRAANLWVLNVDADERITPELKDEIFNALSADSFDGYFIPRKNFFGNTWVKHCGWYPDYNLRLYRTDKGAFSERRVHEAVIVDGQRAYLKNPLSHHTYKDTEDYLKRMERYSTLSAEELFNNGKKATIADIYLRPAFTFFKMYLLKLGFLDGRLGLLLSRLYARYTFEKYSKLKELQNAAHTA